MPRTKVRAKKTVSSTDKERAVAIKEYIQKMENYFEDVLAKIPEMRSNFEEAVDMLVKEERVLVSSRLGNKTLAELRAGVSDSTTAASASVFMNCTTNSSNSTRSVVQHKSRTLRRSVSMIEDEGYLTAGSNGNNTSNEARTTRRSRSQQVRPPKSARTSRSLSRSNIKNKTATAASAYKTPANRTARPQVFGTITPKIKPNTPQVLLRRPKAGEVAVSMQGSPLLVSGVVSDDVPNVNIPLADGTTISIQPQRGLRPSLLPPLDVYTRKQIEALRDNLNKMCASAQTRF